jgi:ABC-type branched-subunit amino acid transport system substrate-binding protein
MDYLEPNEVLDARITRRGLLKGAGVAALGLTAGSLLERVPLANAATRNAVPSSVVSQLHTILNPPTGAAAGQGTTLKVGLSIPLSGIQAHYGTFFNDAVTLASQHIAAMGGPTITYVTRDAGSNDVTKGVSSVREYGADHLPLMITSQSADNGSEIPYCAQFKIFTLDDSASIAAFENKPYYYQGGIRVPDAALPGMIEYVKTKHPTWKKWALCAADYGSVFTNQEKAAMHAQLGPAGLSYAGDVFFPANTTDFSATVTSLNALNADVIVLVAFGPQAGVFFKQYAASGSKARVIGVDIDSTTVAAAGPALNDAWFYLAYFDPYTPPNQWAKVLASEYQRAYHQIPGYYSAFYYEIPFRFWTLLQRIIKSGGNVQSADAYVAALKADPTFPSVFGGQGQPHGRVTYDKTQKIINRGMSLISATAGKHPVVLATSDEYGGNFKIA